MTHRSVDPATGLTLAVYDTTTDGELAARVSAAHAAFADWRATPIARRGELLHAIADVFRARRDGLARLMADEMGKPLTEGRAEIDKCAAACEHYATHAAGYLAAETIESEATTSRVVYRPLGVVLAIMPWNFPFWQLVRFGAPALMAGNAVLLKHAPNVSGCALEIERIAGAAGVPDGLLSTLLIDTDRTAELIGDPRIRAVTLTGSTRAGRAVAATAGAALKKTVLELGGSDPYVVLEDADVELAARTCVTSRLINNGQSCIAAKRFIVVDSLREPFEREVVAGMSRAVLGDPREDGVTLGPLARADLRDTLMRQVDESIVRGARLLLGGRPPEGPGWFFPPTVLTDVAPGMPAFDEELFGPVAAIVPVADERAAIEVANASEFGLGAALFTRDVERGQLIAEEQIEAGCCFVNALVRSDPRFPFGGVKQSGYGRELGRHGILEFVNAKTIYVS